MGDESELPVILECPVRYCLTDANAREMEAGDARARVRREADASESRLTHPRDLILDRRECAEAAQHFGDCPHDALQGSGRRRAGQPGLRPIVLVSAS